MKQERPGIVFLLIILVLFSASVGILHRRKKIKDHTNTMFTFKQRSLNEELLKQASNDSNHFFSKKPEQDVVLSKGGIVDC
jgi:hypothetical protein